MNARYSIRPKADEDLEQQAFYFAEQANAELGHRFLVAAPKPSPSSLGTHTLAGMLAFKYLNSHPCACFQFLVSEGCWSSTDLARKAWKYFGSCTDRGIYCGCYSTKASNNLDC